LRSVSIARLRSSSLLRFFLRSSTLLRTWSAGFGCGEPLRCGCRVSFADFACWCDGPPAERNWWPVAVGSGVVMLGWFGPRIAAQSL